MAMWKTISSGNVWRGEIRNRRKDGKFYWVYTVIIPFYNDGKIKKYFAVRFDITEKKEMEHRLLQNARMAALGEMAGGIAHEINNPLALICLDTAKIAYAIEKLDLPAVVQAANEINSTVFRISNIVKALRTTARDGSHDQLDKISVRSLVENTLPLCMAKFRSSDIPIRVTKIPDVYLNCRPTELSQVLLNLLHNAFDAIESSETKWVAIDFSEKTGFVEISISDSGAGIPENIREKLMEPFFTTKEVGKGMGLGLSISKGIVESHKGTLFLDSKSNHTKFTVALPTYESQDSDQVQASGQI